MHNAALFLDNSSNLRQALIPRRSKDHNVQFSLHPCSGWGAFVRGLNEAGEEIILFFQEDQISEIVRQKVGAPDLFSLPSTWIAPLMRELLKPFDALEESQIQWKDFYIQRTPFKIAARFHWPVDEEQSMELTLFCISAPPAWLEALVGAWEEIGEELEAPPDFFQSPSVGLAIGMSWLEFETLKTLEVGGALRLVHSALGPNSEQCAWLMWGAPLARLLWKNEEQSLEVLEMVNVEQFEQIESTQCMGALAPICVTALVGEMHLSLEELQRLAGGSLLKSGATLYEKVLLLANGVAFAFGELVEAEGSWMVRLTQKFPLSNLEAFNQTSTPVSAMSASPSTEPELEEERMQSEEPSLEPEMPNRAEESSAPTSEESSSQAESQD